jgi:hypothetical protein
MPGTVEQRAYLWIPPTCKHVRGVVVGVQNMLEKPMFEDAGIRQACADASLGIVWVAPGDEKPVRPPLNILFTPSDKGADALDQALADLAAESGYTEIKYAPLLPVGHSAATPFVWNLGMVRPDRVFAVLPYKGWIPGHAPEHMPVLHVSSEWAEWGKEWGLTWQKERTAILRMRADPGERELGEFVDAGTGHFDWNPDSAKVIGMFFRKAADARIPANAPLDAPVALKAYPESAGVLVDASTLGTPNFAAYPVSAYKGDTKAAYWYIDTEMAAACNKFAAERFAKKPQMIGFVVDGKPATMEKNGFADVGAKLQPDGITFKVEAAFLPQSPSATLFPGEALGHSASPIQFRVGSGALLQTGPDTFKVGLSQGGIQRQGNPWEPWVMAFHPGDAEYRPADRPLHVWISLLNTAGAPQTITWPQIANQVAGVKSLKLNAVSDASLPIQYYVVSGPAEANADGTLTFLPIPPRTRYPVKVRIAAFQWGRGIEPRVQSAGPVVQEFVIEKREGARDLGWLRRPW